MPGLDGMMFDDKGRCFAMASLELEHRLGCPAHEPAVVAFAVRNYGFVAMQSGPRGAQIWIMPTLAAPRAVLAARDELRRRKPARTVVTCLLSSGETNRLFAGWANACNGLLGAVTEARRSSADAYLARRRDESGIAKFPALSELHRLWQSTAGDAFLLRAMPVLENAERMRYVVADCVLSSGTSFIQRMQGVFTAFDQPWLRMAPGLRVQDQADYGYGLWIAETYARVAMGGEAIIEDVDIEVARRQSGLIRSRYRRVLLPFASGRPGHRMILSANILDRTVDLRSVKAG